MSRGGALLAPDEIVKENVGEQLVLDPRAFPFAPLKTLAAEGALSAVGLDMTKGPEYTFGEYEKLGTYLGLMNRACMWWIGDWLLYGEQRFGEKWSQALAATGLAEQTLRNRMHVCNAIPISVRRAGLSFSIHAVVAGCKTAKEMRYWLDKAEKHSWNVEQLREAMRARRTETAPEPLPSHAGVDKDALAEIAAQIWSAKKDYGPDFLVPRELIARLGAALGEEE